ncbi:MAG: hypothetical protein H6603_06500 [Flavobacteriales bacterium]|nr:hypothetical protein [Flavobacteriales bacterium]
MKKLILYAFAVSVNAPKHNPSVSTRMKMCAECRRWLYAVAVADFNEDQ